MKRARWGGGGHGGRKGGREWSGRAAWLAARDALQAESPSGDISSDQPSSAPHGHLGCQRTRPPPPLGWPAARCQSAQGEQGGHEAMRVKAQLQQLRPLAAATTCRQGLGSAGRRKPTEAAHCTTMATHLDGADLLPPAVDQFLDPAAAAAAARAAAAAEGLLCALEPQQGGRSGEQPLRPPSHPLPRAPPPRPPDGRKAPTADLPVSVRYPSSSSFPWSPVWNQPPAPRQHQLGSCWRLGASARAQLFGGSPWVWPRTVRPGSEARSTTGRH